jgi:ribose transport system permease protein
MNIKTNKQSKQTRQEEKQTRKKGFKITTEITLLAIIIVIMAVMAFATDSFFTAYNITNLFKQASIIGIIAIASTLVIISAGIDLSVGSLTGTVAMLVAVFTSQSRLGLPVLPSIFISILAGTLVGVYHGFIIHEVRLPPFIATLGSMLVLSGVMKYVSQAQTIAKLPESLTSFANGNIFGMSNLLIVWMIVAVVIHIVLNYTSFGRNIYVIGSSQEVARLSGIRMRLNMYVIYMLAAFLVSIAGILLTSRLSAAIPTGGSGYEMTAIASAVIGGASLSGAMGSVPGTVLGTILMTLITNAGVHLKIDPFVMQIVQGALLTVAVVIDQLRQRGQR